MKMAAARRRGRFIIAGVVAVALGLAGWWATTTLGNISEEREEARDGGNAARRRAFVLDPTSKTARVYIHFNREGTLTIDKKQIGEKLTSHRAQLKPGRHKIKAELERATMTQPLKVRAGEEFLVDFDDEAGKVRVRRMQFY